MSSVFVGMSSDDKQNNCVRIYETKKQLLEPGNNFKDNNIFFVCEYKNVNYKKLIEHLKGLKIEENKYDISLYYLERMLNIIIKRDNDKKNIKKYKATDILFLLGIVKEYKLILKFYKYFPDHISYDFLEHCKSDKKFKTKYFIEHFYFSEKGVVFFSVITKRYEKIEHIVKDIKINELEWLNIRNKICKF